MSASSNRRPDVALARYALIALPAVLFALASACGDSSHIYEARPFVEAGDCLGGNASVDVVDGDRPGNCVPACLVQTQADGGKVIYVSRMCGPYPYGLDRSGTDPTCPAALAALARNATCLADGGSSAPVPADAATQ
jgi:hypothetical protein